MAILENNSDRAKDQYIASLVTSIEQYRAISSFALDAMKYTGLTEDYYGQVRMCMFCGNRMGSVGGGRAGHAKPDTAGQDAE